MTTTPGDQVDTKSLAHRMMAASYWPAIDALSGGTKAIRDAALHDPDTFLPKRQREQPTQWERRRRASHLVNDYADAVDHLASRPFVKPVTIRGEPPPELAPLEDDMDLAGRSLTVQAREVLQEGAHRGLSHLFVDAPAAFDGSRSDEINLGIRPIVSHVRPPDLLGVDTMKLPTGKLWMWRARIAETVRVRDGAFGEKEVRRIKVYTAPLPFRPVVERGAEPTIQDMDRAAASAVSWLEMVLGRSTYASHVAAGGSPGSVVTYEHIEGDWTVVDEREFRFPGIPLVTFYTNRRGFLFAEPFFWRLADLNLQHFQAYSIHSNYVDFAQATGWKRTGADPAPGTSDDVDWGVDKIADLPLGGDLAPIEASGTAYEVGKDFLDRLEMKMKARALDPFLARRSGDVTATGDAIRESKTQSQVQYLVRALEAAYFSAYQLCVEWYRAQGVEMDLGQDFSVDIFSNFHLGTFSQEILDALGDDYDRHVITSETYLAERKRMGLYDEMLDVEEEVRRAAEESASKADAAVARQFGPGPDELDEGESSEMA